MSLKVYLIGEGWLSLLRWLPPPKLSKVGLFRGSHGRRPTTTRPLGLFLLRLCQRVIVEDVLITMELLGDVGHVEPRFDLF
jgi:hypothetical protein